MAALCCFSCRGVLTILHQEITASIIAAFYEVHHKLGHGFLEAVYERAMCIALTNRGLSVARQVRVAVHYDEHVVGEFLADLQVEDSVMVELKVSRALDPMHEAQLINYLRASSIEVGLLLNFSTKPVFRRLVLMNARKPHHSVRGLPRPSAHSAVAVGPRAGDLRGN